MAGIAAFFAGAVAGALVGAGAFFAGAFLAVAIALNLRGPGRQAGMLSVKGGFWADLGRHSDANVDLLAIQVGIRFALSPCQRRRQGRVSEKVLERFDLAAYCTGDAQRECNAIADLKSGIATGLLHEANEVAGDALRLQLRRQLRKSAAG